MNEIGMTATINLSVQYRKPFFSFMDIATYKNYIIRFNVRLNNVDELRQPKNL